jgi:hypothetical protein
MGIDECADGWLAAAIAVLVVHVAAAGMELAALAWPGLHYGGRH